MIDVRQLRIGAHVDVYGKRVEVESITNDSLVGYYTPDNDWEAVEPYRIEPIEITPELLTELGFDYFTKLPYGEWEKRWGEEKYMCFSSIKDNLWRVHYMDGIIDLGNCVCRYLHQTEAFLALHNVELIKD